LRGGFIDASGFEKVIHRLWGGAFAFMYVLKAFKSF
jgi:hypothetical protein